MFLFIYLLYLFYYSALYNSYYVYKGLVLFLQCSSVNARLIYCL
jgi:hypothetical protein